MQWYGVKPVCKNWTPFFFDTIHDIDYYIYNKQY